MNHLISFLRLGKADLRQTAFVMLDEVIKMVNRRGKSSSPTFPAILGLTQMAVNAMYDCP